MCPQLASFTFAVENGVFRSFLALRGGLRPPRNSCVQGLKVSAEILLVGGLVLSVLNVYPSRYIHTHTQGRAPTQTLGREGGLRTPMHMRHMQPHTHRRKPHTPGGERGWWRALKRRGGSAQRRGIPFHVARHGRTGRRKVLETRGGSQARLNSCMRTAVSCSGALSRGG